MRILLLQWKRTSVTLSTTNQQYSQRAILEAVITSEKYLGSEYNMTVTNVVSVTKGKIFLTTIVEIDV